MIRNDKSERGVSRLTAELSASAPSTAPKDSESWHCCSSPLLMRRVTLEAESSHPLTDVHGHRGHLYFSSKPHVLSLRIQKHLSELFALFQPLVRGCSFA